MILLLCCLAVIGVGFLVLALDRWWVRAGDAPRDTQLDDVASRFAVERVVDTASMRVARDLLAPFDTISGDVVGVDAVMRRTDPGATLWLIGYRARAAGPRSPSGTRASIELPLLAIVVALEQDPGWPAFRAGADMPAPSGLPPAWHSRLAAMGEYRMGIEGRVVGFFSQPRGSALVQQARSDTSAEFHPGLLNSALGVDVQRALDLVGALPQAPRLARFLRFDEVDPKLPAIDRTALDRIAATQEKVKRDMRLVSERIARETEQARAESQRRSEANAEQFRQRMDELTRSRQKSSGEGAAASADAPAARSSDAGEPRRLQ